MEDTVQKAVKYSRRRLCIQVVPHELRHAEALSVESPLDAVSGMSNVIPFVQAA